MATYNGEKYLKEQLESLINQVGVNLSILILDDNSSDNTIKILDDFCRTNSNITLLKNNTNLGYKKNFRKLIEMSLDYDYDFVALCDQDDIWLDDKLINGIKLIEKSSLDLSKPILYSSNLKVVNESLDFIGYMYSKKDISRFNFYNLLLENKCTGCTAIFNKPLAEMMAKIPYDLIKLPHDTILERIAILYGAYLFDENSYILYRQHSNNQIGALKKGRLRKYFDFILNKKKSFQSENFKDIFGMLGNKTEFLNFITPLVEYKKSFRSKIKILFSKKYKKTKLLKTVVFRISILLNKY